MQKKIWYGIKGSGDTAKVRLFSQPPAASENVSGVGECTLTYEDGTIDVLFPDNQSLFSGESETVPHSTSGQATA